MASEIVGDGKSFTLETYVRGHHVYHTLWTPIIGEILPIKRELKNVYDRFAVAVLKDGEVVGHEPRTLRYDGNMVFIELTGERVNRGILLGVEVPCVYKFLAANLVLLN